MIESQSYNNVALLVGHIIADCPNPAVPTTYVKKEKQCFNCQQYVTYTERERSAFIWPIHADLYRATLQETVQTTPSLVKRLNTNSIDSSKSFATTAEASIIMQRTV